MMRLVAAPFALLCACGAPPPATLTQIEKDVFAKSCAFTSCHLGSSPAGGLNLEGRSYVNLVNVKSAAMPSEVRVVASKPESSWLMKRHTGKPPLAMPPDEPLDAARLELVRSWIADGAKNN